MPEIIIIIVVVALAAIAVAWKMRRTTTRTGGCDSCGGDNTCDSDQTPCPAAAPELQPKSDNSDP